MKAGWRRFWRFSDNVEEQAQKRVRQRIFYEVADLAAMLGVKAGTVRLYIRQGRLKAQRRFRGGLASDPRSWRWVVTWPDLRKFLEQDLFPGTPALRHPPYRERNAKGQFSATNGPPSGGHGEG